MYYGHMSLVHEDERRAISEFNSREGGFSVQKFEVKASIPLGNHYHQNKFEMFMVLRGGGKLVCCAINPSTGQPYPTSEPRAVNVVGGSVIKFEPYTAHAFVLEPGSRMICFSNAPFDPDDLIPCKLV